MKSVFARIVFLFYFLLKINNLFSQETNPASFVDRLIPINTHEFIIKLKKESNLTIDNFSYNYRSLMGLSQKDNMKLLREETDKSGGKHYRFQQYYDQVKIDGCEIILHEKNEFIQSLNGSWIKNLNVNTTPTLTEDVARQFALDAVKAQQYRWQVPQEEQLLKKIKNDSNATYFPEGKLLLVAFPFNINPDNFKLAYKFNIYSQIPFDGITIYIDATSGKEISRNTFINYGCTSYCKPLTNNNCATNTRYNGHRSFDIQQQDCYVDDGTVDKDGNSNNNCIYDHTIFNLTDGIRNIETRDEPSKNIISSQAENEDCNIDDDIAISAHWGAEMANDYYESVHNRNGYDNIGSKLTIYVHNSFLPDNAYWYTPSSLYFGDGDGVNNNPWVSLDMVGHELTHGVIGYSVDAPNGFEYSGESGALGESFADIFGAVIEFYINGSNGNWIIGEDITINGIGIRNMSVPNGSGDGAQPDTYEGDNWYTGTNASEFSHTNSGVGNFWFYLLSEGGEGTNDNIDNYCVEGLGIDKAAGIAYTTLTNYLTKNSGYYSARSASILATQWLYGANSNEEVQVTNAWYAVGVGQEFNNPILLQNRTLTQDEYVKNKNDITASNNFNILSGVSCTFQSETKIYLESGFHAHNGSNFHAFIAPVVCQSHKNRKSKSVAVVNNFTDNNPSSNNLISNAKIKIPDYISDIYPNPFTDHTHYDYSLPSKSTVTLTLHNLFGQEQINLINNKLQNAGEHTFTLEATHLPDGIYFCSFEARSENGETIREVKKLVKMK